MSPADSNASFRGAKGDNILTGRDLRKIFRRDKGEQVVALDGVSLEAAHGSLTALVGPDGAGKTTLLRLATGLLTADAGEMMVLGIDAAVDPQQIQSRIGYMPQRFGLYEDLSVQENLDLYADMHGVKIEQRKQRYAQLMEMTDLGRFTDRLAGQLSGGMKQKLGLACTLVRAPELLLLDEPTVGVDPLSRRDLWKIIDDLVHNQGLTVLISTSYLDEADRCGHVIVLNRGKVLAQGKPQEVRQLASGRTFLVEPIAGQTARLLQARLLDEPELVDAVPEGGRVRIVLAAETAKRPKDFSGLRDAKIVPAEPRFEDGFMMLLRQAVNREAGTDDAGAPAPSYVSALSSLSPAPSQPIASRDVVVEVRHLVRQFGSFTAVDHISFDVRRGEIFGLLGPNGAGKTTTFRMICGLLAASGGTLRVAGVDLRQAQAEARQRIGYVAQKFSLYGELSVTENLEFFAGAYGLRGRRQTDRIAWALREFELTSLARLPSAQLPGGYKQRLAMGAALLHEPEILFLDEPTSGADPLARREFWRRITALAAQGVTIIVTTHFMEEAEYCDGIAIMDGGRVLAQGTPADIRSRASTSQGRRPTMEDAFIAVVESSRGDAQRREAEMPRENAPIVHEAAMPSESYSQTRGLRAKWRRIWSLVRKEAHQIVRDPSSIAMGVVLPVILIVLFGYGLSLDVKNVPVAIVLEEPSPDATELAAGFQLSPYFEAQLMTSMPQARELMLTHKVDGIVRIPPDLARRVSLGDAEVEILVQGVDANRARIIQGYAEAAVAEWAGQRSAENREASAGPVLIRDRLWFNVADDSHYFLVPGLIVLVMTLTGAMLTAMTVAREWERGTLEAIFVTPVRSDEILLGKTIPNFALGMFGLALCLLAAKYFFHVPFRGSVWVLAATSMLYLLVALGVGLLISSATKSQFVASQLTMLLTFLPAMMLSGFLFDLRSMPAVVRVITYLLPARYYVSLLQTIFLVGDIWAIILPNAAVLAGMAFLLLFLARRMSRKKL